MPLPPLYKYLSLQGAKLTLGNGTFRHAKPSDFNDDMDMTLQSAFPVDMETALEQMKVGLARIIFENLDKKPTCYNPEHRAMVLQMQEAFRANPDAVNIVERELEKDRVGDIYDVSHMKRFTEDYLAELNAILQGYRVLCVTDDNSSIPMWKRYSADHSGVVLRITPNKAKDSKFTLFRKVNYEPTRPTLYESTQKFREDALFGDLEKTSRLLLDKIVYTKTLEWKYEQEYRLAVPLGQGQNYDTLSYHPEEVTEVFLGAKIGASEKDQIIQLALAPAAAIPRAAQRGLPQRRLYKKITK